MIDAWYDFSLNSSSPVQSFIGDSVIRINAGLVDIQPHNSIPIQGTFCESADPITWTTDAEHRYITPLGNFSWSKQWQTTFIIGPNTQYWVVGQISTLTVVLLYVTVSLI